MQNHRLPQCNKTLKLLLRLRNRNKQPSVSCTISRSPFSLWICVCVCLLFGLVCPVSDIILIPGQSRVQFSAILSSQKDSRNLDSLKITHRSPLIRRSSSKLTTRRRKLIRSALFILDAASSSENGTYHWDGDRLIWKFKDAHIHKISLQKVEVCLEIHTFMCVNMQGGVFLFSIGQTSKKAEKRN